MGRDPLLVFPPKSLEALLFAGRGDMSPMQARMAHPPVLLRPQPEAVEVEIDDRRRIEGQQLADDQPADDGNTKRAAQL